MSERLLTKQGIAEALGTSPDVAAGILAKRGVYAIDFGRGRGRGARWLASAVDQALRDMHAEQAARNAPKSTKVSPPPQHACGLARMSASEIFNLTQDRQLQ